MNRLFRIPSPSATRLRAIAGLIACAVATVAMAADWKHRLKVGLDSTAPGAELTQGAAGVPLAVRLHSGNFTFADAKPDGSDIRFLAPDGKTPLKFHLEQFDAPNELAVAWVQVPKVAPKAKADAFVIEWGNPAAAASGDAAGTYDATQLFVLHFSDKEGVRDATANGNHASASSARPVAAGPMGGALAFGGAERVELPGGPTLKLGAAGGMTISLWVKPEGGPAGTLLSVGGAQALTLGFVDGVLTLAQGGARLAATAALKPGAWQHVAATVSAGQATLYIDGASAGSGAFALADVAGPATIGAGFKGELDEVGLAATARSADYIRARAAAEAAESPLLVFDPEGGGESASYIGILLGAVTLDGWIVIGILGVMFVISVWVMATKARFLLRAARANAAFLDRFREGSAGLLTPGDPAAVALAGGREMKHSPIYRVYAIGLAEIRKRFEAKPEAPRNLSGPALEAIAAAMDAGIVRESQRMNSQIVLLTIAISGGPFLGLLGTVVGVMITFAAIAAAGDVNVNAIAPGIAAALVATVAGLGVAIPALFGYNWLASKIKEVGADTQVFADEFRTRAAELYQG